ncbi:protein NRT1/ PTR FAMILY 2.11-like [Typha angustifolia]|uniref:protein NRT1/ PTR FAMILY 2.11-like n=1 Tax=Typha angustifolia TaxID=59011 RepID=UPI003C2CDD0F
MEREDTKTQAIMEKEADKEEPTANSGTTIKYRGWKVMPYVIGNETFEKLGTTGTISNLLVYLTTIFHMKSATAAITINLFSGTTNIAPVLGAFLSDSYFGRYTTLGFASVASLTGMLILTLTAGITAFHPPHCEGGHQCRGPTSLQLAVLFSGFGFLVVGAGGIRPCNLPFGADQFDPGTDAGRRGINSFFNWYYFTFTTAMMLSSTLIIYVQSNVSWSLGLAIPTALMFIACALFFVGTKMYVRIRPEGSPFTSTAQVLVAAWRKRGLELSPEDPKKSEMMFDPPHLSVLVSKLPYTDQFRALDKAAITTPSDEIKPNGHAANPWRLCSLQQVEEVKCLARIIPVWSSGVLYYLAIIQQSTYTVFEALQSDRHLGSTTNFQIPAASFVVFSMLALTIWIPIYDRVIVPRLRRITGIEEGLTLLQRMGVGIILAVIGMVVAAFVEERRRSHAVRSGKFISPISSLWLVPQLVILGFSEAFTVIGQVEFYYKQFPEHMRSVGGSLLFCGFAVSNYLSGLTVTIIHRTTGENGGKNWLDQDLNKGRLDLFYLSIAVIGVANFFYFVVCAKWYKYKKLSTNSGLEIALEERKMKVSSV